MENSRYFLAFPLLLNGLSRSERSNNIEVNSHETSVTFFFIRWFSFVLRNFNERWKKMYTHDNYGENDKIKMKFTWKFPLLLIFSSGAPYIKNDLGENIVYSPEERINIWSSLSSTLISNIMTFFFKKKHQIEMLWIIYFIVYWRIL